MLPTFVAGAGVTYHHPSRMFTLVKLAIHPAWHYRMLMFRPWVMASWRVETPSFR